MKPNKDLVFTTMLTFNDQTFQESFNKTYQVGKNKETPQEQFNKEQ